MKYTVEEKLGFYNSVCFSLNINLEQALDDSNKHQLSWQDWQEFIKKEQQLKSENNMEERNKLIKSYQTQTYEQMIYQLFSSNYSEYKIKQRLNDTILKNFKLFLMDKYQLSYEKVENIFPKAKQLLTYFSFYTHFHQSDFFAMLQGNHAHMTKNFLNLLTISEEELLSKPDVILNEQTNIKFLKNLNTNFSKDKIYDINMELENFFTKDLATKYLDVIMSKIDLDISDLLELTDNVLKKSPIISTIYHNNIKHLKQNSQAIEDLLNAINFEYELKAKNISRKKQKLPIIMESKKEIHEIATINHFAKKDFHRIKEDITQQKPIYTKLSLNDQTRLIILIREEIKHYMNIMDQCSLGIRNFFSSEMNFHTALEIEHIYIFLEQQAELLNFQEKRKAQTNASTIKPAVNTIFEKTNKNSKTEEELLLEQIKMQEQRREDKEKKYNLKKQMFLDTYW
ncbi:MAG: hypothetical protein KH135_06830, partial [Firmicutes bacterium]|nr:hypothetical protein [Bacillota bacterium]